jgi:hypothetical protein
LVSSWPVQHSVLDIGADAGSGAAVCDCMNQ